MRNEIYDQYNSTRSVNIKIALQTDSPDHREIIKRIICQSEDVSVDAVAAAPNISAFGQCALFMSVSKHKDILHKYRMTWKELNVKNMSPILHKTYILSIC